MTAELDFSKSPDKIIPAIAQDVNTNEILMLAYMNKESWEETVRTGKACYWSRSRKRLWRKGEESGNVQIVKEIFVDCDLDTIVLKVEQIGGAACHEGYNSCFFRKLDGEEWKVFKQEKIFDPEKVYGKKK
ncbi:TPA: phosphoribosyl-AMP cyclohydrolase [bacterium]|nr:MAG: phosphoribosyl-AMP cyclohydrolase [Candidatus Hydrogenedentes bacterium CG1_02_42_14]PIU48551.1 MAG: phosphoribosyl-AMP cyclohydrolase [Candidatus Hydrogenedentes bacterium CG07_land_8_20_14_0_80_42_17]HBW47373.1 phosphoribosyl-AMP cyclohydrolase [bacterium]